MREISTLEVQAVAGGAFSFASIGASIGSTLGGFGDTIFGLFGATTALSSSLGQVGQGIGQLFDAPLTFSISGAISNIQAGATNIIQGGIAANKTIISAVGGLFNPSTAA